ncbi:hypothetical protein JCM10914A_43230 [Paenibacillus sp. JCM 10914]|uniref:GNAT family N-acetyltransferase n=1 Tax=Paenibacillus sp. JCM 10914 TaxID=1236974 RepID=UPI0003CC3CBA|nr:GNAT family N-acetyltransferase [Paenibacillus sp. JCM 10914]GAE05543.1 hypothetical protein JCM10914_1650 [Paenibacillus sp. JCM 10914]
MIRRLTSTEMDSIRSHIQREQHFLYYSYLTCRQKNTVHFGQFSERGDLVGVLAYMSGLPFHAFSVYPIKEDFQLPSILAVLKHELRLPLDGTVGSFIVSEDELARIGPGISMVESPQALLLMKHVHRHMLPLAGGHALLLDESYKEQIESRMIEWNTMAFAKEELQYPFYGVIQDQQLVAVGGYHVYSDDYVELGNIVAGVSWRGLGYGKEVSAALTRQGLAQSPYVYLNVLEENERAIRLYSAIGYDRICKQYIVKFNL